MWAETSAPREAETRRNGNFTLASELSDREIASALETDNPLTLGEAHRVRAKIALLARDRELFDEHYAAMCRSFQATKNPSLIAQCDALLDEAQRAGVRAGRAIGTGRVADEELDGSTIVELERFS